MRVHVFDIDWDTQCDPDDTDTEIPDLPESMMIASEHMENDDDLTEMIANCLSYQTGFCVRGFDYKIVQ